MNIKLLKQTLVLLLLTTQAIESYACGHGFFPKSADYIGSFSETAVKTNIHAANIVDIFQDVYSPIFKEQGKTLQINFDWENSKLNAYATRDDYNNPVINITGGLATHDLITQDSLSLILCHEVGHFLGGAPKKRRGRSTRKSWSSAEGQADYYATAFCMKKIFAKLPEQKSNTKANRYQQESAQICNSPRCKRIALASLTVARIYAEIDFFSNELSLISNDDYTVYETVYGHSNPQCRLDTMISGLLCPNSESIAFDDGDLIKSSCKANQYRRPRCWFYPEVD